MPAAFRERRLKRNRVRLEWQIFRPDFFGTWVQIEADLRGPRVSKLRAQVEAMVASFRFEPAPTPLASGKAAADAIAAVAVQTLQWRDRTTYACFPPVGVAPVSVVMALPSGTLRKPLPVICSTAIQRTDIGFWRLKLVARWQAAADRRTGHETTIQWLYPDGRIAASIGIGSPPAPYCCV
jgi:hypothetical protein